MTVGAIPGLGPDQRINIQSQTRPNVGPSKGLPVRPQVLRVILCTLFFDRYPLGSPFGRQPLW